MKIRTLPPFRTDLEIEKVMIENFSKKGDFLKSLQGWV